MERLHIKYPHTHPGFFFISNGSNWIKPEFLCTEYIDVPPEYGPQAKRIKRLKCILPAYAVESE